MDSTAEQLELLASPHPLMPELDISRCYSKIINYETAARMVKDHHYAHRVPHIRTAVGMFVDDALAGCITYGIPAGSTVTASICGSHYAHLVLELNRLFVHDWAGYNSESWLIGQSFRLLKHPAILLSFADPAAQHVGYIYQATNWLYTGLSWAADIYYLDSGEVVRTRRHIDQKGIVVRKEKAPRKHRYVYFLGNKKERKELRTALRYPVLSYPKH